MRTTFYVHSWHLDAGVLTFLWEYDGPESVYGGGRGGLKLPASYSWRCYSPDDETSTCLALWAHNQVIEFRFWNPNAVPWDEVYALEEALTAHARGESTTRSSE